MCKQILATLGLVLILSGTVLAQSGNGNAPGIGGGTGGGGGGSAQANGLVNYVFNVRDFGTVGNCSHDDTLAIQNAVNAACLVAGSAAVYFPSAQASACYFINPTIFIPCDNLKLFGPSIGGNPLIQQPNNGNSGPMFVVQGTGMQGPTLVAPIITGSNNSASWTHGINDYYINLLDDPSLIWTNYNGLTAFTLEAYFTPSVATQAGFIFGASGRPDEHSSTLISYALQNTGSHYTYTVNMSDGQHTLTDNTNIPTNGTRYDGVLTYDGTTLRMYGNGTNVASVTDAAATLNVPYYVTPVIGDQLVDYPDAGDEGSWPSGTIGMVQISNIARHTGSGSYSPCNCMSTLDNNTLGLWDPGSLNQYMDTQLQFASAGNHTVMSYTRRYDSSHTVTHFEMDDLSLLGRDGSIGIIGQDDFSMHIRNVSMTNMHDGIYLFNNDFESNFDDLSLSADYLPMYVGFQSGLTSIVGNTQFVGGVVGFRATDSGIVSIGTVVQGQTSNVIDYDIQGDSGSDYFTAIGNGVDQENCDSTFIAGLKSDNNEHLIWEGGAIAACGNNPAVEVDGGSNEGQVYLNTNFSSVDGTPPEWIYIKSSNLPHGFVTVQPAFGITGSGIQISNSPADVVAIAQPGPTLVANSVCDADFEGALKVQTDSTASCSAGTTATSAGTTHCQVYCNGTNWIQTGR